MSQGRILGLVSKNVNLRKVLYTNIARIGTAQPVENHQTDAQSRQVSDEILREHDVKALGNEKGQLSEEIGNMQRMAGEIPGRGPPPSPPECCCMSGCNNCVWIGYIEEMKEYYQDGGKRAMEAIDKIPDVAVKTFLKIELCN